MFESRGRGVSWLGRVLSLEAGRDSHSVTRNAKRGPTLRRKHLRAEGVSQSLVTLLHLCQRAGETAAKWRWVVQFIRPRQVVEMIGVSRTTLWRMVQAGTFPRPVRITERNCGFLLETVEAWMKARAAELAWEPESGAEPKRPPMRGRRRGLVIPRQAAVVQG